MSWLVFPAAFPKAGKINSLFKLTTQGKAISQAARRNFELGSTNYRPLRSIKGMITISSSYISAIFSYITNCYHVLILLVIQILYFLDNFFIFCLVSSNNFSVSLNNPLSIEFGNTTSMLFVVLPNLSSLTPKYKL